MKYLIEIGFNFIIQNQKGTNDVKDIWILLNFIKYCNKKIIKKG